MNQQLQRHQAIPVEKLPELDQNEFPPLPNLPEGKTCIVYSSPLGSHEREAILAVIITVCVPEKKWHPAPAKKCLQILKNEPYYQLFFRNITNAAWELMEESLISIVRHDDQDYLVPTPAIAHMLEESGLRYIE